MGSESGPKVRLVKCPKCLELLTEVEDVPVYQCGGCFTILQAKKRSINADVTSSAPATDTAQESVSQPVSEYKGSSSSSPDTVLPSSTEFSLKQEHEMGQNQNGNADAIDEHLAGVKLPDEDRTDDIHRSAASNDDSDLIEGENSGSEVNDEVGAVAAYAIPNSRRSLSSTDKKSETQPVSEYKGSSSSSPDMVLPSSTEFSPKQEHEMGQNQNGNADTIDEQLAGVKLPDGDRTDDIHRSTTSDGDSDLIEGENSGLEVNDEIVAVAAYAIPNLRRSLSGTAQDEPVSARGSPLSAGRERGQEADDQPSSDIVVTSPHEEEQNQRQHYHEHPHMESTDDIPNGDFLANKNPSAYDGSASSSDGKEDKIRESQLHMSPSTDENDRSAASEEMLRKGKLRMQGFSGYKEQRTITSVGLSEEKHKKLDWNRPFEPVGHPWSRNWSRNRTDEFMTRLPFYRRGPSFSGAYECGSPSYASHNEFHSHPHVHSYPIPLYGGGFRSGSNHIPAYSEHEALERLYNDISYVRHVGGRSWGQTGRLSGIPLSGEATMNRRHLVGHSGQFHNFYGSYPGSPWTHIEPPGYYPRWSQEIVSEVEDHHRPASRELHMYMRERQPVAKRHVRPVAGGAPFVICYHCSGTMQLPVDFLIFKRKYHFLRCGACKNVLRFSIQDTTHLVPAVKETQTKPSRDVDTDGNDDNSVSESCRDESPTKPEKMSSSGKNDKPPVARGSPLHRLMGYSSISQVFKVSRRPSSLRISDYNPTSN